MKGNYSTGEPSCQELVRLRAVALGKEPADLIIRNGKVVNVYSGEILEQDIAISGRHIAAVTPYGALQGKREFDSEGQYVAPNFIESHFHIEYSMLRPGELAQLIVPRGTTPTASPTFTGKRELSISIPQTLPCISSCK